MIGFLFPHRTNSLSPFWAMLLLAPLVDLEATLGDEPKPEPASRYARTILADKPIGYWTMEGQEEKLVQNHASSGSALDGRTVNNVVLGQAGPRSPDYPLFTNENRALLLDKSAG